MEQLAQGLASLGRNGDSMLVHMTPKEVQGLQQLALAKGGSLTINPHTGLPEAFDLGDILPSIVGIGASILSGGTLSPLMTGLITGATSLATTGDPGRALTSGILSGGLSGLMGGVESLGGEALTAPGGEFGIGPSASLDTARMADNVSRFTEAPQISRGELDVLSPAEAAQSMQSSIAPNPLQPSYANKMQTGFDIVKEDPLAFAKDNKMALGAAGLGLAGMMSPQQTAMAGSQAKTGSITPYNFEQAQYDASGRMIKPASYTSLAPRPYTYYAAGGGSVPNTFPQSNIEQMAYSKSSANPMPTNVVGIPSSDYDARINQQGDVFTAAGGGKIKGYKAGGPYGSAGPIYGVAGPIYGVDSSKVGPYQNTDAYASIKTQMNKMSPSMLDRYAKGAKDPIVMAAAQQELYERENTPQGYFTQPTMAQGGTIKMADGGLPGILGMMQQAGLFGPQQQEPVKYDYDPNRQYYTKLNSGGVASLGEYAAGGKLLKGPGDGMSDSIPAVIKGAKPQRAALAQGEFVVPADVVSHLGNGSTDAGAKRLYAMMDKVRMARTGNKKQGRQINPAKFMPA